MQLTCIYLLCALVFLSPLLVSADSPAPAPTPAAATQLQTPYHTEQEWIISTICRNAYELLAYAKDKKGESVSPSQVTLTQIPGDPLSYDVTLKGANATVEAKLAWPGSLWSPAAYVPFCQAAAQALKLPPPGAFTPQGNSLHDLLPFTEAVIQSENTRISQWLAAQPDNASAHEQAALVLGTLALKENSGFFWDPRETCNQVCIHLAVAQYFRGNAPVSIEGRLANICIGLIVDTKTQTGKDLDNLAPEKSPPADLAAWINAARMRNTRDWRIVKTPETASPLEQVEYFRAYSEMVNPDLALAWLKAHNLDNRIDWQRITLAMFYSVDAGHVFAEKSIPGEIYVMQQTFPGSFSPSSMVSDLNEPAGDAVAFNGSASGIPIVISRGLWAQFFQRHLCHAIEETGSFFVNSWGVPEYAQQLDQVVDKNFAGLTLYPLLKLVEFQTHKASAAPVDELVAFNAHPEWAAGCLLWQRMPPDPDSARLTQAAKAWFTPTVVHGTAYGATRAIDNASTAEVDQLYAIAPLQLGIAKEELKRHYGSGYSLDQYQKIMGPLLDYSTETIAYAENSIGLTLEQQVQLAQKSADIDPNNLYGLAKLYQDHQQDDKAAEYYQKWYDASMDRVTVSNYMDWLVSYYYDHGQADKAMTIAKEGAEVYSSGGLQTMMHLQEKMGHLDRAEDYGKKIDERYKQEGPLTKFYGRHPNKVTLASFSGPPTAGIKYQTSTALMQAAGLTTDQVVVALDGNSVGNILQYDAVRGLSTDQAMTFIVWDGQAYKEIHASPPGRRFGVQMQNYHP